MPCRFNFAHWEKIKIYIITVKNSRKLIEEADDISNDNPMAYNEMFSLTFLAPYIVSKKKYWRRPSRK